MAMTPSSAHSDGGRMMAQHEPRKKKQKIDRMAYRPRELAEATGLSVAHVYNEIAAGNIRSCRVGRAILVPAAEATRLLSANEG